MRFAVVSAYPTEDWHSSRIIRACAGRGTVGVFAPTAFSLCVEGEGPGSALVRADGHDARDFDVWLLPRALGAEGDPEFQCEVYRILQALGLVVVNPVAALLRAEDKVVTSFTLRRAGVRTPDAVGVQSVPEALRALAGLGVAVVKPPYGSLGIEVARISAREADAEPRLSAMLARHGLLYLQRYVRPLGRRIRDLRLFVVGEHVPAAVARVAASGEFRTNVHQGGKPRPLDPAPEACGLAVRAARALGLEYAGVDMLETSDGYTVLEVNGTPRWEGILQATGRDMADEIVAWAAALADRDRQQARPQAQPQAQPRRNPWL
jgi:tetrahydromethanopterin:alpha-L-glutamate ligase